MKKLLVIVTIIAHFSTGCKDVKQQDTTMIDSNKVAEKAAYKALDRSKFNSTDPDIVKNMASHYEVLVSKDPRMGLQQINMDGQVLSELLTTDVKGIKFIAAADPVKDTLTMFIQLWIDESFTYYNIYEFFNATQEGLRGKPVLCPPPGNCDLPFNSKNKPMVITGAEAQAMANLYNEKVIQDPGIAIRQITMDADLLHLLLYGSNGFSLIYAYNEKKESNTVVMQFWRGGEEFSYHDIRDIFYPEMRGMHNQPPLCPPPSSCEIPFLPFPKAAKNITTHVANKP